MRPRTLLATIFAFLSAIGLIFAQQSAPHPGGDYCDYPCGYGGGTWGPQYTRMIVVGTCTTTVKLRMLTCMMNGQVVTVSLKIDAIESNCPIANPTESVWSVLSVFTGDFGMIPQGYFIDLLGDYPAARSVRVYTPSCVRVCHQINVANMPESPQTAATNRYATFPCGTDCCIMEFGKKRDGCLVMTETSRTGNLSPYDRCYRYDNYSCPEGWQEYQSIFTQEHECAYVCNPQ